MNYKDGKYLYPPRPEKKIPFSGLSVFDNETMVAQPKFDGSCTGMFFNPEKFRVMNRHNQPLSTFKLKKEEITGLIKNDGWNVIYGEYMNKSKKDEFSKLFNNKYVIFDILVHDDNYLVDSTFKERIDLMYDLFPVIDENEYSYKISDNVYLVKTFYEGFEDLWTKFTKIEMIEGLVMKRLSGKLEMGLRESNTMSSQVKCRRETKNFQF
jgi:hypothetical protein